MLLFLMSISGSIILLSCKIDHGLEPIRSGFSGTIHYLSAWPDSISEVRIVTTNLAFDKLLDSISKGDITDLMFSEPRPTYVDSSQYTFWAKPGTYSAVVLAAKKANESWSEKSIIAFYPPYSFLPKPVDIPEPDSVVQNIDFIVRFK